jgi:hypothetical protein
VTREALMVLSDKAADVTGGVAREQLRIMSNMG